ncbi:metallophosphoesterase [Candidatus Sumerlaeota bacterium]|nr:metallophosphoesterase [Candidatus Sumerlaeota bacterium]
MFEYPLRSSLAAFAIAGACVWLFFAFYNIVICSFERSLFKSFLKLFDALLFLFFIPFAFVAHLESDWAQQILTVRPASPLAASVVATVSAIWLAALGFQAWRIYRTFRPPRIENLVSVRRRHARFHPSPSDWAGYREMRDAPEPVLRPGAPPPPKLRRKTVRIRPHPIRTRIFHSVPFSFINQSHRLEIVEMTLRFPDLPPALDGLRLVQLSDMHFGEYLSPRYHHHVIDRAIDLKPDIALITGDYTASDNLYRESVEIFSRLQPPLGTWSVHGNHDYYTEPEFLAYWLEYYGVNYLCNRSVDIERGKGQFLRLVGADHPYRRVRDWKSLVHREGDDEKQVFRLGLTHRPDNAVPLIRNGADLVLSGHTHGGQWRIPGVGPLIVPSIYGRRFDRGLVRVGRGLLYINSGFGVHTIPLRLNCPPEIALIELRRGDPSSGDDQL